MIRDPLLNMLAINRFPQRVTYGRVEPYPKEDPTQLIKNEMMYGDTSFNRYILKEKVSLASTSCLIALAIILAIINLPILLAWGTGAPQIATAATLSILSTASIGMQYAKYQRTGQELNTLDHELETKKQQNNIQVDTVKFPNSRPDNHIHSFSKEYREEMRNYNSAIYTTKLATHLTAINMPIFLAWGTGLTQIITASVLSGIMLLFSVASIGLLNYANTKESNNIQHEAQKELEYHAHHSETERTPKTSHLETEINRREEAQSVTTERSIA